MLLVRQGGKTREVRANQSASLTPGQDATLHEEARPALVLPAQEGLQVFHAGLPRVTLSWPAEAGDARVQVSEEKLFERPFLDGTVKDGFVNVPAPRRGALYWRVLGRGRRGAGTRAAPPSRPSAPPRTSARVRNEVPDGREKTTIFYQDKPPAVTFTWPRGAGRGAATRSRSSA